MDETLTVRFRVEEEDIVAFQIHHFARSATMRRQIRNTRLWILVLCVMFVAMAGLGGFPPLVISVVVAPLGMGYVAWVPRLFERNVRRNMEGMLREGSNDAVLCTHTLEFGGDTLVHRTQTGIESQVPWRYVTKVEDTGTDLYIYLSSLGALMVGRTKMEHPEEYAGMVARAEELWAASRPLVV